MKIFEIERVIDYHSSSRMRAMKGRSTTDSQSERSILLRRSKHQLIEDVNKLILKRLDVSNGFPVSYLNTEA